MTTEELALQLQELDPVLREKLQELLLGEKRAQRERQAEGIRRAKEKGVRFGRPRAKLPNLDKIYLMYSAGQVSLNDVSRLFAVSRSTIYRRMKDFESGGSLRQK